MERGHTQLSWLDSRHSFSFDQYYDTKHMSFGPLRVINEDKIAPGGGFGTHPHRDMEIITYVVEGQLQHKDSLGNGSLISPGEIQKMSAGTGILHSEFNASEEKPVHLLQIWIVPDKRDLTPAYEQERFQLTPGEFKLLGGPGGGLVTIHQNVNLYGLSAKADSTSVFTPRKGSKIWIQVVKGKGAANGTPLKSGDGLAVAEDSPIEIRVTEPLEILLFEILGS
jgi:redox-sensitive bicupin YhaK (pirin superfamily)